ncbi:uncharacterized protein EV422DRAFT_496563, partial [Fimicolochytrium jonesii]|uniref:uncharacterized protein n=1 Tax=Fimicolochytrium jonesii TaxID=1396493 RepID=UPI0022FE3632
ITCNHCGTSPIRGIRFKCANCVDFDVCEACEALEVHLKTHVFIKVRVPIPPLMNARSAMFPVMYPGRDYTNQPAEIDFSDLQIKSNFDVMELKGLHEEFLSLSTGENGGINATTFKQCLGPLGLEKNLIVDRIFHFFDRDEDGIIRFEELVLGLSVLCKGGFDERLKWAFRGYDLDSDGFISRDELHQMFKAYFNLSMELVRDVVKTMEEGMMDSFDDEGTKPVSAAFAGPSGRHVEDDNPDGDGLGEGRSPQKLKKHFEEDSFDILARFAAPGSNNPRRRSHVSPSQNRGFRRPSNDQSPTYVSPASDTLSSIDSPTSASISEQWPVMEAMSQNAIQEMVDKTFELAGLAATDPQGLSFEAFVKVVEADNNLLSWFEALGSVF